MSKTICPKNICYGRCGFLLNSCDAYSDTWDAFFDLLNIYWPDLPYKVYLNTETINYKPKHSYSFEIITINTSNTISWSKRLMKVLDIIEEDYVLMTLDDFFLQSLVKTDLIEKLIYMMEIDLTIASFQLTAARIAQEANVNIGEKLSLNLMSREGWKTHFIPTIWRKNVLRKWLRPWESIWGFEGYGSQRARVWNYKEKVYTVDSPIIYDYLWVDRCSVIVNGKWYASPLVDQLFESNGIIIDFAKRGRITLEEYKSHEMKWILSRYSLKQIVIKSFNRLLSLF
ncbi:MAG: hypothetical protein Q3994_00375 [Prevotella sp.]|nr:hypothetical protein [Prevotella sp.]